MSFFLNWRETLWCQSSLLRKASTVFTTDPGVKVLYFFSWLKFWLHLYWSEYSKGLKMKQGASLEEGITINNRNLQGNQWKVSIWLAVLLLHHIQKIGLCSSCQFFFFSSLATALLCTMLFIECYYLRSLIQHCSWNHPCNCFHMLQTCKIEQTPSILPVLTWALPSSYSPIFAGIPQSLYSKS